MRPLRSSGISRRSRPACSATTAGRLGNRSRPSFPLDIDIGDLTTAIANARRAIEIYFKEGKPGSATHAGRVRKLGSALLAARASSEAAERLEESLRLSVAAKSELDALHARGSFGLALAYLGRFDEADEQLRQTIEQTGPASARAQHLAMRYLGTLLRLQGRYVESLQWLEKSNAASALQPSHRGDHAHGLLEAGLARLELGELDTAAAFVHPGGSAVQRRAAAARHARARRSVCRHGARALAASRLPESLQSARTGRSFLARLRFGESLGR